MNFLESLFKKQKGCLHGKTEEQKKSFFYSLAKFAIEDEKFFTEQYGNLLPHERMEFFEWMKKDMELKMTLKNGLDMLEKIIEAQKHIYVYFRKKPKPR